MELDYRRALEEGRRPTRRVVVREFSDGADEFLDWAKSHYREHPNSYKRIKTILASAKEFFCKTPVSLIDERHLIRLGGNNGKTHYGEEKG